MRNAATFRMAKPATSSTLCTGFLILKFRVPAAALLVEHKRLHRGLHPIIRYTLPHVLHRETPAHIEGPRALVLRAEPSELQHYPLIIREIDDRADRLPLSLFIQHIVVQIISPIHHSTLLRQISLLSSHRQAICYVLVAHARFREFDSQS